ncbi:UNVERIFIED_CONTAM: hypothetical protein GTU68_037277, partial [Idotea baltica]|nr:hypothetical protein [Idotea baltica]
VGRDIPIIGDDYVDRDFGTGCVKITPAHDFNDAEMGQRHSLEKINILTNNAEINDNAPEKYRGLDRYEARKAIVQDLDDLGLLDSIKDHKLMVPRGDRSGAVIEPLLTDQWYVKADALAEPAVKAVQEGRIKFVPGNWDKTFYSWMDGIQDWCISRQIWWGHRIPAWYDQEGTIYVGENEASIRADNGLSNNIMLKQDDDVLDTWFSSALWPFSTLGWPNNTEALKTWYPGSVLVTGFDIIFFWVARMMMMGLHFMDDIPFKEVYIHGLVRDSNGHKMSKSKGNVLDPIDGINSHGTDALRFTFASLASTGRDINFDMNRIAGYRNFCNKLWNAARYVLINTENKDTGIDNDTVEYSLADRWILSQLQTTTTTVSDALDNYRFDHAAQGIYEFIWHHYCDWYLELSKPVLNNDQATDTAKRAILRLTHPIMPFITEEIWQTIAPLAGQTGDSIMNQRYPIADESKVDQTAVAEMEWLMAFISGIRSIRSQMNIPPKKQL